MIAPQGLKIRKVALEDCRLLWHWANDPDVRASAFSIDVISWTEHQAWFKRKLGDPNCLIYIVLSAEEKPVGQVRFEIEPDGSAQTDISLAGEFRGQGLGIPVLDLACQELKKGGRAVRVEARIKAGNLASFRTFKGAGFVEQGRLRVKGSDVTRMTLEILQ